jgi:hypothetical protein
MLDFRNKYVGPPSFAKKKICWSTMRSSINGAFCSGVCGLFFSDFQVVARADELHAHHPLMRKWVISYQCTHSFGANGLHPSIFIKETVSMYSWPWETTYKWMNPLVSFNSSYSIRIFHSLTRKSREMSQNSLPCIRWNTLKLLSMTSPFRLQD